MKSVYQIGQTKPILTLRHYTNFAMASVFPGSFNITLHMSKRTQRSVGADYAVSKIHPDYETSLYAAFAPLIIHI